MKINIILKIIDYRETPFTIGVSRIGGSDYFSRFSNRKEKPNDVTIQEIRNGILKTMFQNKSNLSNSDYEDFKLYSEAVNLGCEYFVTQNTKHFGKEKSKKRQDIENFNIRVKPICKIRTVDEFLREIEIVERN